MHPTIRIYDEFISGRRKTRKRIKWKSNKGSVSRVSILDVFPHTIEY